eukprot:CAMPEP_0117455132 /NCGR_PEP_ID=MMETSP0759-20121206/11193_1 /TAXON_ID=63605 /ORGANISM="Percolomonas cosmopolitus, Strain WS" /LENGTH=138 /DNA_ID=CAMNT_0005248409 /DNA_START=77 /DNA_END=491 /DNA_ORIENTATION=+
MTAMEEDMTAHTRSSDEAKGIAQKKETLEDDTHDVMRKLKKQITEARTKSTDNIRAKREVKKHELKENASMKVQRITKEIASKTEERKSKMTIHHDSSIQKIHADFERKRVEVDRKKEKSIQMLQEELKLLEEKSDEL